MKVLPFREKSRFVLVDTTVWVDYLRQKDTWQTAWLDANLQSPIIAMLDLTFCELLQGQRSLRDLEKLRDDLVAFRIFSTGGTELAEKSARNYVSLRQRGVTIRTTVDCLIATFAIEGKHMLLHNDRDFDPFEKHLGLAVLRPA